MKHADPKLTGWAYPGEACFSTRWRLHFSKSCSPLFLVQLCTSWKGCSISDWIGAAFISQDTATYYSIQNKTRSTLPSYTLQKSYKSQPIPPPERLDNVCVNLIRPPPTVTCCATKSSSARPIRRSLHKYMSCCCASRTAALGYAT